MSCNPASFKDDQHTIAGNDEKGLVTSIKESSQSTDQIKFKIRCAGSIKQKITSTINAEVVFTLTENRRYLTYIISGEFFHKLSDDYYIGFTVVAPREMIGDNGISVKIISYIVPSVGVSKRISSTSDPNNEKLVALKEMAKCLSCATFIIYR